MVVVAMAMMVVMVVIDMRELDITATDLGTNVIQDILTRCDHGGGCGCDGCDGCGGDCGDGCDGYDGGDDQYEGARHHCHRPWHQCDSGIRISRLDYGRGDCGLDCGDGCDDQYERARHHKHRPCDSRHTDQVLLKKSCFKFMILKRDTKSKTDCAYMSSEK